MEEIKFKSRFFERSIREYLQLENNEPILKDMLSDIKLEKI